MQTKVKKAVKNKDINSMFNDILGEGVVPPHIALSKYEKLRTNTERLIAMLESFSRGNFAKTYPDYDVPMAEILVFCKHSKDEMLKNFVDPPFSEVQLMIPNGVEPKVAIDFSNTYKKCKEMDIVKVAIKTCNALITFKSSLSKKDEHFIRSMPGAVFAPLPFSSFNIKEAFIRPDMTEHFRSYILVLLSMVFEHCYNIFQVYTSCDWDPELFKSVMQQNLGLVKKQIPRCERAFQKIEDSLDLLKDNIDGYYRDFMASRNPSIMMENFVNDVAAANDNVDLQTAQQFKTIIRQYQKCSNGKPMDSRMKSLFDEVNELAGDTMRAERAEKLESGDKKEEDGTNDEKIETNSNNK